MPTRSARRTSAIAMRMATIAPTTFSSKRSPVPSKLANTPPTTEPRTPMMSEAAMLRCWLPGSRRRATAPTTRPKNDETDHSNLPRHVLAPRASQRPRHHLPGLRRLAPCGSTPAPGPPLRAPRGPFGARVSNETPTMARPIRRPTTAPIPTEGRADAAMTRPSRRAGPKVLPVLVVERMRSGLPAGGGRLMAAAQRAPGAAA